MIKFCMLHLFMYLLILSYRLLFQYTLNYLVALSQQTNISLYCFELFFIKTSSQPNFVDFLQLATHLMNYQGHMKPFYCLERIKLFLLLKIYLLVNYMLLYLVLNYTHLFFYHNYLKQYERHPQDLVYKLLLLYVLRALVLGSKNLYPKV